MQEKYAFYLCVCATLDRLHAGEKQTVQRIRFRAQNYLIHSHTHIFDVNLRCVPWLGFFFTYSLTLDHTLNVRREEKNHISRRLCLMHFNEKCCYLWRETCRQEICNFLVAALIHNGLLCCKKGNKSEQKTLIPKMSQ